MPSLQRAAHSHTGAKVLVGVLAAACVSYAASLMVVFCRHQNRAAGAVLTCLLLLVVEGWVDPLHLPPIDRAIVLAPLCLSATLTWAALTDRRMKPAHDQNFNEKISSEEEA